MNYRVMRIEYPIDMKQMSLEKEQYKFLLYAKNNFDICPLLPNFVMPPHISCFIKWELFIQYW